MSPTCTDQNGKQFQYHEHFSGSDQALDFVVLSNDEDKVAFKVARADLLKASPVFKQMFATCQDDIDVDEARAQPQDHVHLHHEAETLAYSLLAVTDRPLHAHRMGLTNYIQALDLCVRYDAPAAGRRLLNIPKMVGRWDQDNYDYGEYEAGYAMFSYSSKFDDVLCAARVISVCGHTRYHPTDRYDRFWTPNPTGVELFEKLPSNWVWAYMSAHQNSKGDPKTQGYWNDVAMRFIKSLIP